MPGCIVKNHRQRECKEDDPGEVKNKGDGKEQTYEQNVRKDHQGSLHLVLALFFNVNNVLRVVLTLELVVCRSDDITARALFVFEISHNKSLLKINLDFEITNTVYHKFYKVQELF